MSTAAVSSNSIYQELQSFYQQRRSDLQQLGKDLQSGDLTDAQQEYQALQSLGQSGPFANGDTFRLSGRQQDFQNIGSALQSGDVTAAEQALQQLGQSFQHPASGAASPTSSSASDASTNVAASTSSAGGPEIVLNLANMPAGEQITIGLSSGANGAEQVSISAENAQGQSDGQIMLNLSQNTNEQIVLNLFNSSATSSTQGSGVNVSA
jgi:hypothetical protein